MSTQQEASQPHMYVQPILTFLKMFRPSVEWHELRAFVFCFDSVVGCSQPSISRIFVWSWNARITVITSELDASASLFCRWRKRKTKWEVLGTFGGHKFNSPAYLSVYFLYGKISVIGCWVKEKTPLSLLTYLIYVTKWNGNECFPPKLK